MSASWRLTDEERERFATDGYVVREPVFAADELAEIIGAGEELVERMLADRRGRRYKVGSEQDLPGGGMTFWSGGSVYAVLPPVCTNQFLESTLDADGQPTDDEAVNSTDILQF